MPPKRKSSVDDLFPPKKNKRNLKNEENDTSSDESSDSEKSNCDEQDYYDEEGNLIEKAKPKPKRLYLPGGAATVVPLGKCDGSGVGEVPKEVTKLVRDYMDIVFGAVMLGAERLTSMNERSSVHVIPEIVDAMLRYNNREFDVLTCDFESRFDLVEPIWYTMNITNSRLNLFIDQQKYDDFCLKNSDLPVLFPGGTIPIEIYDPCKDNPNFEKINLAMIHCVIACDHVVTHILSDMMDQDKLPCSDYHKGYAEYGTTLHTMFQLDMISSPISKCQFQSTILPFPLLPGCTFSSGLLGDVKDDYSKDRLNIPTFTEDEPFDKEKDNNNFTFQFP